ncbi:MAG: T9SS type A sorting domain-containing protein [Bacteroidota bacterium]
MKNLLSFILLLAFHTIYSQNPTWEWAHGIGGANNDAGLAICSDTINGDVIVAGNFKNTIFFDTINITSSGSFNNTDIFLVKYSNNGSVKWARRIGGDQIENVFGICNDLAGNIYITGNFLNGSVFDNDTLISNGGSDFYVAKYDANGNYLWSSAGGGTDGEGARDIATDAAGNIYVTGEFFSPTFSFGTGTVVNSAGNSADLFLLKYDTAGNELWGKNAGGNSNDYGTTVTLDGLGNIIVGGGFLSSVFSASGTILNNANSSSLDALILKYDATGNLTWAKSFAGTGDDGVNHIDADAAGNIVAAGFYNSPSITAGTFTLNNSTPLSEDLFILKLNSAGNVQWALSAGGTDNERADDIEINNSGTITVAVNYESAFQFGNFPIALPSDVDFFVSILDSSGNIYWVESAGSTGRDNIMSMAHDNSGAIYTTGYYESAPLNIGPYTLSNSGSSDIFIAKLSVPVGINNHSAIAENISIFPNPGAGIIHIRSQEIMNAVTVFNTEGKIVLHEKPDAEYATFELNQSGIYMVRMQMDKEIITRKIIINK